MTFRGLESKPATDRLSNGTALFSLYIEKNSWCSFLLEVK
jgi:hypothetical protein